jgi:methionyl-tRNA formyltransferase
MGTAELSCDSLRGLLESPGFQVVAVVTQPDRPKGRDLKLQASPVKVLGLSAKLPVLQPERARSPEFLEELRALQPDLIAVAAYGQILPVSILGLPRFGCLNVHTSLLPRYRGAAPIQ